MTAIIHTMLNIKIHIANKEYLHRILFLSFKTYLNSFEVFVTKGVRSGQPPRARRLHNNVLFILFLYFVFFLVKNFIEIMNLEQSSESNGCKDVKLSLSRLNPKLLKDYLLQKDDECGCNSALTLRYFLLSLELDELKKQKNKCHVLHSDEINLLPSLDSCSPSKSGLFYLFFKVCDKIVEIDWQRYVIV